MKKLAPQSLLTFLVYGVTFTVSFTIRNRSHGCALTLGPVNPPRGLVTPGWAWRSRSPNTTTFWTPARKESVSTVKSAWKPWLVRNAALTPGHLLRPGWGLPGVAVHKHQPGPSPVGDTWIHTDIYRNTQICARFLQDKVMKLCCTWNLWLVRC